MDIYEKDLIFSLRLNLKHQEKKKNTQRLKKTNSIYVFVTTFFCLTLIEYN